LLLGHEKNIGFLKLKGLFSEMKALKSLLSPSIYFLSAGDCSWFTDSLEISKLFSSWLLISRSPRIQLQTDLKLYASLPF